MYLALCQRVARRAGVAGSSSGKPDGVTGQTGRMQLVCDYVAEAVREIESEHVDWTFMALSADFFVESGESSVNVAETQPDVLSVNERAVYGRDGQGREQRINPMSWPELRERRETAATLDTESLPSAFAVDPSGVIQVYPASANEFVLRAECVLAPTIMAADDDAPRIPASHHDAILWRALCLYHEADEAGMLLQTAEARYAEWLSRLEALFLPNNTWSRTHSPEELVAVRPA